MKKHLRKFAMVLLPVFMLGSASACNPEQVDTAKKVFAQAEFYVDMAEALVVVAVTQFPDNDKVTKALVATQAALAVVKATMRAVDSGLSVDESALKKAVISLVVEVFNLARAIEDAKKAVPRTT